MSDDLNLTALQVEEALSRPPDTNDNGDVICQVCDRPFTRKGSLGVHQLVHRRAVGLAPPMVPNSQQRPPKMVVCRFDGCTEMLTRSSLPSHLKGKHRLGLTEAAFYARQRRDEDIAAMKPTFDEVTVTPVKRGRPPKPKPEPVTVNGDPEQTIGQSEAAFHDITAAELVTGILNSARRDGRIPITMLPDVIDLIAHVEAFLVELSEYAETEA